MITILSWSLGACPNTSLNLVESLVPPLTSSDSLCTSHRADHARLPLFFVFRSLSSAWPSPRPASITPSIPATVTSAFASSFAKSPDTVAHCLHFSRNSDLPIFKPNPFSFKWKQPKTRLAHSEEISPQCAKSFSFPPNRSPRATSYRSIPRALPRVPAHCFILHR